MNTRNINNRRRNDDFDREEADAQLPYRWWLSAPSKTVLLITFFALAIAIYIASQLFLHGGTKKEEKPAQHGNKVDMQFHRNEAPVTKAANLIFPPENALPDLNAAPATTGSGASLPSNHTLFAFASGDNSTAGTATKTVAHPHEGEDGQMMAGDDDALSSSLHASNTGKTAKAHLLKHPRLTVTRGTSIPCILRTKIDTTLPGLVVCESREEVRGHDGGTVPLLKRWTRFTGQIRRPLTQFEDRVSIVWTSVLTPDNIEIDINSPATDMLGAAGVDAQINNHVPEKIGAVLLYTVIEAGPALAVQALQNQSNNGSFSPYSYNQVYQPSQQVAGDLLRQKMMRPPIAIKNQGEEVMVMVAQNWDLSDVIELQAKQ
jgi:type IV secretory pathway VirB10-like protein